MLFVAWTHELRLQIPDLSKHMLNCTLVVQQPVDLCLPLNGTQTWKSGTRVCFQPIAAYPIKVVSTQSDDIASQVPNMAMTLRSNYQFDNRECVNTC